MATEDVSTDQTISRICPACGDLDDVAECDRCDGKGFIVVALAAATDQELAIAYTEQRERASAIHKEQRSRSREWQR